VAILVSRYLRGIAQWSVRAMAHWAVLHARDIVKVLQLASQRIPSA
jgi:hypothetical protein